MDKIQIILWCLIGISVAYLLLAMAVWVLRSMMNKQVDLVNARVNTCFRYIEQLESILEKQEKLIEIFANNDEALLEKVNSHTKQFQELEDWKKKNFPKRQLLQD